MWTQHVSQRRSLRLLNAPPSRRHRARAASLPEAPCPGRMRDPMRSVAMVLPTRTAWRVLTGMLLAAIIAACGGGGGSNGAISPPPQMTNRAPVFTSTGAVSVLEETAGTFHTVMANDPDGNSLTFSLQGGA